MDRRRVLSGGSLVVATGLAGCVGALASRPDTDTDTLHVESDVWGDTEGSRPDTRAFGEQATALERVVGPEAERFAAFVRGTDFESSYLALVQGIGVGSGTVLTLRETERIDDTLYVTIDEWPPEDDEPRPGAIFVHSLTTRVARDERGLPETVAATVERPEDRSLTEEIGERF